MRLLIFDRIGVPFQVTWKPEYPVICIIKVNQIAMTEFTEKYDATGLNCPLPILRSKKVLNGLNSGDILYVISTDSGSVKDFDAFCKQTDNELLESSEAEGKYHYYIRKN
jgi:tRNA 2-thiouridine synthesizing protein A